MTTKYAVCQQAFDAKRAIACHEVFPVLYQAGDQLILQDGYNRGEFSAHCANFHVVERTPDNCGGTRWVEELHDGKSVCTWGIDGDGDFRFAIEEHTQAIDATLTSRFDDDGDDASDRPIGFALFEHMECLGIYKTLDEAMIEGASIAYRKGFQW